MKGIVLTAGRGSRLGAATEDRPKALVRIEGRTLLDRQIAALQFAGAGEVGVVVGWKAETFSGFSLPMFENPQWATTSMVDSLACASDWLRSSDCLICYGDIIFSRADAHRLASTSADLAISYDPAWLAMWRCRFADPLSDAETFCRDDAGRLVEIGQRAADPSDISGQYLGLLRTTPVGWAEMDQVRNTAPAGRPRDMTDLLNLVVQAQRIPVWTIPVQDPWWEFDIPADLLNGAVRVRAIDLSERCNG